MRIIIEKDGVKREIKGNFRLCMSPEDARSLAKAVQGIIQRDSYGWVDVYDSVQATADTAPLPWEQSGNCDQS